MGDRASEFEYGALTLDELLSSDYIPAPNSKRDDAVALARLDLWLRECADGDAAVFAKRLARDGLDRSFVLERLGGVQRVDGREAPAWVAGGLAIEKALSSGRADRNDGGLPFEPLWAPIVDLGVARLRRNLGDKLERLCGETARADMTTVLAERVCKLCELPLYEGLMDWRKTQRRGDGDFASFVEYMHANGWRALLVRYPVLLRLLWEIVDQWLGAYTEFVLRLSRDLGRLQQATWGIRSDAVTRINSGLSDFHNEGRSVLIVEFACGRRLVYKPKDLRPDVLVGELCGALAKLSPTFDLSAPRVIVREEYGWAEWVEQTDCGALTEISAYYRRCGAWLALFHVLATTDMHMENIVARGAFPMPVDFETILQGAPWKPPALPPAQSALWAANAFLENAVVSVGMLPAYVRDDAGGAVSVGGLEASRTATPRIRWRDVNAVAMRPEIEHVVREVISNLPTLAGAAQRIDDHGAAFLAGFTGTLEEITRHRTQLAELISRHGENMTVRRVIRPTRFYYMMIKRLSEHRRMKDGVTWSMQSEFLSRLFDWDGVLEDAWKVFRHERRALTRLNVPMFKVAADKAIIQSHEGDITNLDMESGRDTALERLSDLSGARICVQRAVVATTLQVDLPESSPRTTGEDVPFEVVRHLRDKAFVGEGALAWLGLDLVDHQKYAQIAPLGPDLYAGVSGIAIFFAGYGRARGDRAATQSALDIAATCLHQARSANARKMTRSLSIGAGVGVGSVAYAMTLIAEITEQSIPYEAARAAARLIDCEAIKADARNDAMAGSAGACLALVKLAALLDEPQFLDTAILCAEHLETSLPSYAGGLWSSTAFNGAPLTGLSHGAAGYALAFSKLFARSGDARWARLANYCVEFENARLDEAKGDWPDLRPDRTTGAQIWPTQWCYGAIGIGLGRLAMLGDGAVAQDVLMRDVNHALRATLAKWPHANDTLCCGAAGNIDFLLTAGRALKRTDLIDTAQARFDEIAKGLEAQSDFRWDMGDKNYNLGLFRGVAGIGYVGLRLSDPALPSCLAWS